MEIGSLWNQGVQRVICICQARAARLADGTPVPHDRCDYRLKRLLSSFLGPGSLGRIRSYHELMKPGRAERRSRASSERAEEDWKSR